MTDEQLTQIKEFLIQRLSPYLIYLFGSQARKQTHRESDFDLAYLSDKKIDIYERFMLAQELAALLNRDVDLVDLQEASTVFQTEIIASGQVLYCTDESRRMLFEMYTLKKYARLNEERAEILESFVRGLQDEK